MNFFKVTPDIMDYLDLKENQAHQVRIDNLNRTIIKIIFSFY